MYRVFKLIKDRAVQLKKEKESQLPEKPSIWRRNCRQERYVAFPPLYEGDEQTGLLTQKLMDEYGLIPQDILRQAIGDFYEKITQGQHEGNTTQNVDDISEARENSCSDNYSLHGVTVNQTVDDVEIVNQAVTVEDVPAVNQAVGDLEFVNQTVTEELQEEEYLQESQESDIELTQNLLDKAIDTLIQGNWETIRDLFNQHPEIKEQAWNALSSEQKRRVVDITPETVKVLNQARKDGVIQAYKEIAAGVYQVKLPNKLLWEQRAFHEIEIRHYLRRWGEHNS